MSSTPANASPPSVTPSDAWWERYLGKPWEPCGRGPDGYDCWGLVHGVLREQYGYELPLYLVHPDDHLNVARSMLDAIRSRHWGALRAPEDGCVVAMSPHRMLTHVGVYSGVANAVVHATAKLGVMAHPIPSLSRIGYNILGFYKWQQLSI